MAGGRRGTRTRRGVSTRGSPATRGTPATRGVNARGTPRARGGDPPSRGSGRGSPARGQTGTRSLFRGVMRGTSRTRPYPVTDHRPTTRSQASATSSDGIDPPVHTLELQQMGYGLEDFVRLIREVVREERREHQDGTDANEQDLEVDGSMDAQAQADNPPPLPLPVPGQGL